MKKILLGFAVSLIALTANIGIFAQSQFSNVPPNPPQGYCEGTGNYVTYNTLPWSAEWHYLRTSEWISDEEADSSPTSCEIYPDTSQPTCQNANSMNQNTENTTCMFNKFPNLTRESDFIAVRKCQNGNCDNNDPIHIYDEGTANSTYPTYDFSLNNSLSAGDKIRVIVHLHNTAIEGQFPTSDTKLHLNWNETQKTITSFVEFTTPNNASYANPGVTTNSDPASVSLPNLGGNLKLVPSTLSQLNTTWNNGLVRSYSPSLINPNGSSYIYDENNKSITYDLGPHISSYPNRKYVYIDFDVVTDTPAIPHFTVRKEVVTPPNGSDVQPGDSITYRIIVNNDGDVALRDIVVHDTLDTNLIFVSGDSGVTHSGGTPDIVTLNFATLNPIQPQTSDILQFTVKVSNSIPSGVAQVCNDLDDAVGLDTNNQNVNGVVYGEICHNLVSPTNPHFIARKTAVNPANNSDVQPGDQITYQVTVTNDGDVALHNIVVQDTLDENLIFDSGDSGVTNLGSTPDVVTLNFSFPPAQPLQPGQSASLQFTVHLSAPLVSRINKVCNDLDSSIALDPNNQSINGEVDGIVCQNLIIFSLSSFEIEKTANPPHGTAVNPGDTITYTINVHNTGNTTLTNINTPDHLDNNVTFVSGSGTTGVSYDNATHTVTMTLASLNAGDDHDFEFSVQVVDPFPANISEVCNGLDQTPGTANNPNGNEVIGYDISEIEPGVIGPVCHPVNSVVEPEYTITKTDSLGSGAVYTAGQSFNYIITVENTGTVDIDYIEATDVLENRLEWDATTNSQNNPDITYNSISRVVTIPFHNIPAGQSMTRTFAVKTIDTLNNCDPDICNTVKSEITTPPTSPHLQQNSPNTISVKDKKEDEPKKDIIDTFTEWGEKLWESTKNLFKNLFTAIIGNQDIIENPAKKTKNTKDLGPLLAPTDTTDQFCRPVFCDVQSITKTADPVNGSTVVAGDTITYSITITNPSSTTMTNVVATDDLDSNLVYDGSDFVEVTENPANSGHIILNFGDIDPVGSLNNSKTLTFRAKVVATLANGAQTCNTAEYTYNGETHQSNEVCHNFSSGGSGGGGGSGETNYSVGNCEIKPNGTGYCQNYLLNVMFPTEWKECMEKNGNDVNKCKKNVALAKGLTELCTTDSKCRPITMIDITPPSNCVVGGCAVLSGIIEKTAKKSNVAVNELAPYKITLTLRNETYSPDYSGYSKDITINRGDLKIYDITIPSNTGNNLKGHILENNFESDWQLIDDKYKPYFTNKNPITIGRNPQTITLEYKMNTLLSINEDTQAVDNVAFANMSFSVNNQQYGLQLGGSSTSCNSSISVLDIFSGNASTYGSTARVEIDRPFVQVRSGADLGIKKYNNNQNPFGGYRNGKNGEQRVELEDNLFNTFVENEIPANLSGGTFDLNGTTFQTSADNSNVWVYKGNGETITLTPEGQNGLALTEPATFIIKNANLKISRDFALTDKLAAFIVDGGDIIIDASVKNIQGIFIATDGKIKSSNKSEVQLVISGAIMGDATDLLQKRIYIGDFENGELTGGLQPSVKINYDVRLLDDTPPALEAFLGEGSAWGQDEY